MNTRTALVALAGILATLTACSTPQAASPPAPTAAYTIENCGRTVTFTEKPTKVAILNGVTVTEVQSMIELGLSDTIVANTQSYGVSDIPGMQAKIESLPTGGLTMNQNFGVPAEQLLASGADLVISPYAGGFDRTQGFATRVELERAGIKTLINPVGCANGATDASPSDQELYDTAGVADNQPFLTQLGEIFDVTARAEALIAKENTALAATSAAVEQEEPISGIVISPGAADDVPAVWTGGIFDDVLGRARVTNAFEGEGRALAGRISAEQLAASKVDLLIIFADSTVDGNALAAKTLKAYPQWEASKKERYVVVNDGMYFGPAAIVGVDKVARAAHPDAF
ncbi:MAG: ABC transporter substrate-binding protein [Propionibacteriales bacterium]|nr:ABC transporter substrate-binding protein [Propionibacteriales bacterium]